MKQKKVKKTVVVGYTDGASRGNPGPAGIGIVMYDRAGKVISEIKEYIGETTNNIAEYQAVIRALEEARKFKADNIELHLDSELVINQLNGNFRTRNTELQKLLQQARALEKKFKVVKYNYIERKQNKIADKLANIAINLQ